MRPRMKRIPALLTPFCILTAAYAAETVPPTAVAPAPAAVAESADAGTMPAIFRRAQVRREEYAGIAGLTIEQQLTMLTPMGKSQQNAVIRRKGDKFRLDGVMRVPTLPPGGMSGGPGASPGGAQSSPFAGPNASQQGPGGGPSVPPQDLKFTVIFDGRRTWMLNQNNTAPRQIPNEASMRHQSEGDLWMFIDESSDLTRTENVKGTEYYVVEGSDEKGLPIFLWIDRQDFLIRKAEFQDPQGGRMTFQYSDYQPLFQGGPALPRTTEVLRDGRSVSTVQVRNIRVEGDLPDDVFDFKKVQF